MHHSRLCAVLIDCRASDVDAAARFWGEALGRPVDLKHPASRGNYRILETPPDKPVVQIQRVEHESRVPIDIETDDIPAEVMCLEKLGAGVAGRLERWVVMQAPTGQRFCLVRVQRPSFRGRRGWPRDGAASGQVARARSGSEPRIPPRRSAPPAATNIGISTHSC